MTLTEQPQRDLFLKSVMQHLLTKLPSEQQPLASAFANFFLGTIANEDLFHHSPSDIAARVLSQWHWLYQRQPGQAKVRITNPRFKTEGWDSPCTVIQVSHDDMPFLVDSIRMEVAKHNLGIHWIVHTGCIKVARNKKGEVERIAPWADTSITTTEAPIYLEIDRIDDNTLLAALQSGIEYALQDVCHSVRDWQPMLKKLKKAIDELTLSSVVGLTQEEKNETLAFLQWLHDEHFTFLGYREYEVIGEGRSKSLRIKPESGLGVLHDSSTSQVNRALADFPEQVRSLMLSATPLIIAKTNTISTVHRAVYTDYIGIKQFDSSGEWVGECRFIGLYTSSAYHSNPQDIPLLRHKVARVMEKSQLVPKSHAAKSLLNILETFPRDDLFQADIQEITEMSLGILNLQERDRVRLFARKDIYARYVSCLVYVPRDRYNTELQRDFQKILENVFASSSTTHSLLLTDSVLVRVHYTLRIDPHQMIDLATLVPVAEKQLIEVAQLWQDNLAQALLAKYGDEKGAYLHKKYLHAFSPAYKVDFNSDIALKDIKHLEHLNIEKKTDLTVYQTSPTSSKLHVKIFQQDQSVPISDVMPILENMGLRVLDERPYIVKYPDGKTVWINDFTTLHNQSQDFVLSTVKQTLLEALEKVWLGEVENDGFNRLILTAKFNWRDAALLRAIAKYLRQINFNLSQSYIENTLLNYAYITGLLVTLFYERFNPELKSTLQEAGIDERIAAIESAIDEHVTSLDEDKIFRYYLAVILATLRTNFFQKNAEGRYKNYISFKLSTEQIPDVPLPCPKFEIFVYSSRFEGVHLRLGKVARGGIRWSDRREDFRTEILGLVKAQQVKNAVIVPAGAKGGFVPKHLPMNDRNAALLEAIACYKDFIRGLLDLTDNILNGKIVSPSQVICYDEADPYLVVAADKGTASFSDIANVISAEYNFWLNDAFASGGSNGYDHKKIGITARGAWESVKLHFRRLGINPQSENITVVGIGDMSGDVFGNAMLLSRHLQLVGAFNHQHIFIDPNPEVEKSYAERERLFQLPRSSWADYNRALISNGGGVFERSAKSVNISPEMKVRFGIDKDKLTPVELIRVLLTAKVDLLWNGGIGTYVKSRTQLDIEVGDKANDLLRVDGEQLACRVVGEGGNLGFTQLGRIEYSLKGGKIYTDFIDNSGGVDCSDHEVNLKIFLHDLIVKKILNEKERNTLLAAMTEEVANLVLYDNYAQTQALEITQLQAEQNYDLYCRYLQHLVDQKILDPQLEFLPDQKTLLARKAEGKGFTQPELAILFAYTKITLKHQLLKSDLIDDPDIARRIRFAFPHSLVKKYGEFLNEHPLRREIIATQVVNYLVNEMGCVFVYRLQDELSVSISSIVKAYSTARAMFDMAKVFNEIQALDYVIDGKFQLTMQLMAGRLLRRATRWLLRYYPENGNIKNTVANFSPDIAALYECLPEIVQGSRLKQYRQRYDDYLKLGVPAELARKVASASAMFLALDIVDASHEYQFDVREFAESYFALGNVLELGWLREQITDHTSKTQSETLGLTACRDDIDFVQRCLTVNLLQFPSSYKDKMKHLKHWLTVYEPLVKRWQKRLADIRANEGTINLLLIFIALRELVELARISEIKKGAAHVVTGR